VYLGMPIWLSLTTVLDADGVPRTRRGEPAADVYALVADVPEVVAVGVNCTAPAAIGPTVAAAAVAGKPIVVYPNSGESWDAVGRRWTGSRGISADDVPSWVDAGARLIGGCCRVRPADIERIAAAVRPS
jgi:homocysteine S-methyltransferase